VRPHFALQKRGELREIRPIRESGFDRGHAREHLLVLAAV
jgi:hypothetical protein